MRRKFIREKGAVDRGKTNEKVNYKGLVVIIIGFLLFTVACYFYVSTESSKPVFGKVVMLNDTTSDSGVAQWIVVELNNGHKIQAILPNSVPFKKDKQVKLIETKTKLFGAERYRFAGYQE
jgi:hypothetical protein